MVNPPKWAKEVDLKNHGVQWRLNMADGSSMHLGSREDTVEMVAYFLARDQADPANRMRILNPVECIQNFGLGEKLVLAVTAAPKKTIPKGVEVTDDGRNYTHIKGGRSDKVVA